MAYRHLFKYKGYTLINVFGLAAGISCCLLILLFVFKETSYDRFHENSDRIYRLVQTMRSDTRTDATAGTPFPAGPALKAEYPHLVEAAVRLYDMQVPKLSLGKRDEQRYFKESNFFFADSVIFDVFSIKLRRGSPATALQAPQSLIISERMVEKYFGDEDPIGKQLHFEGRLDLTVTAVMEELPDNSHMDIDFLVSLNTLDLFYKNEYDKSWYWNPCWTYLLLDEDADIRELENQLPSFEGKYYTPNIPSTDRVELNLQPLTEIYLHSNLDMEIQANSDVQYIYIFSVVAVLILFIACFNFMNLATARSAKRSKEVAMRKVLGADRWTLITQFMGESYVTVLISIFLALGMVHVFLPYFNNLLNTHLVFDFFEISRLTTGLLILFVLVGMGTGIYPALFLSGFQPVRILRGIVTKGRRGYYFRRILVILQFSFSILLIIGSLIIYQQLDLLRDKKMGFDNDQVVMIPTDLTRTIWYYEEFKQRLLQSPDITHVTGTRNVLGSLKNMYYKYIPEGRTEPLSIPAIAVMHDFVNTYGIELLAGRFFSKEYATDRTQAVIINKQMVTEMGWGSPRDALGKTVNHNGKTHFVIGVTENFNHTSLRRTIEPLILDLPDGEYAIVANIDYIAVRINGDQVEQALDHMQEVWNEFDSSHPFEYFFHDQQLDQIYRKEESMASVSASFTLLAIMVACLGLYGLASYTAETRIQEIGIRKVMGASIPNIISLLSREFVLLVLLANLLAWPAAYIFAVEWLSDFAYRIELGLNAVLIFFGSGCLVLFLSVATVSYQSYRAAIINPADTIREE